MTRTANAPSADAPPSPAESTLRGQIPRIDLTAGTRSPEIGTTGTGLRGTIRRRFGAELVVAALALVVFTWRVAVPNPWRDELVTLVVARRPTDDILDLVSRVDLVHATYYLLVHAVFGETPTLTLVRMLSVLAACLTAVLLVRIGRALDSPSVGLAAGLLFVASPLATRYAQEARPYALVTLATTASMLALLRACRLPWKRRNWALYALSVVATALFNVLALSALLVHAVYVAATSRGWIRWVWALTTGTTLLVLTPFVLGATTQRSQVSWLTVPPFSELRRFFVTGFQPWQLAILVLAFALLLLPSGTNSGALGLGLAWAVLPPTVLWLVSQLHPLFALRYVVVALPGAALALASVTPALVVAIRQLLPELSRGALRRLPEQLVNSPMTVRVLALLPVLVLALGGLQAQSQYRSTTTGHAENVKGVADFIARNSREGDAVLFVPGEMRIMALGFPEQFSLTDDVALAESAKRMTTIYGVDVPGDDVGKALHGRDRIWVISGARGLNEQRWPTDFGKVDVLASYRFAGITSQFTPFEIRLYERPRLNIKSPCTVGTWSFTAPTHPQGQAAQSSVPSVNC